MSQAFASSSLSRHTHPFALRALSVVSVAVLLAACGGEGDGLIASSSGNEVLLTAREATVVQGELESVKYRLTSMAWSIMPLAGNNPELSLTNSDCLIAVKNDMLTPTPATASSPAGSGGSTWQCNLVVYAKEDIQTDAVYRLQLTGTTEVGQQVTYQRTLRVQPNPVPQAVVGVGEGVGADWSQLTISPQAAICKPGAPIQLTAQGIDINDPGFYYRWSVLQGPEVVLAGVDKSSTAFIAAIADVPTLHVIQLEVSKSPLTPDNLSTFTTTAVVNSDPAYAYPLCSAQQQDR